MTEKELRKLSRLDLIDILIRQSKEITSLQEQLAAANKKLEDKVLICENAGNIAQAALEINKIFETAQLAADQYLESLKHHTEEHQDAV